MAAIFSFKCSHCGGVHEGSPSFAFRAPDPFLEQPQTIQDAGKLSSDLCYYHDEQDWHYFIRVVLEVPIHGVSEPFLWGVWVSLSETNYQRYVDQFDHPDCSDRYFGWLCNDLPYYESTYALKTHVHPRANNQRPYIVLERTDHELSQDFHHGMSREKARQIAETCIHW